MSALGTPVLINSRDAYWLSSIANDVVHSTIQVQEIDANIARISSLYAENIQASTVAVSTLSLQNSDVSGMYVSSIRGNTAFFSTMTFASDLSGGVGYVRFSVDASGIQVDGDPIRFDNLVYLTSTINIVQVSTIVDTDIFAQKGYFSTLSTGVINSQQNYFSSVVFNDMSGNTAELKQLTVSSIIAGDISGVDLADQWSLYPTLNSSITFQPGFVLSNIGPNLYFAGVELTDVSGGGQDWSRFPAVSTVLMGDNSITQLSTLQYQDGGKLYSATGNNLFYNGQQISYGPGGATSNWSLFPAISTVNMNSNIIFGATLTQSSNLQLLGSNITNGNTFTNSLGVGGLSVLPIASINSGGDLSCRNIDVGDSTTSLADVNIYGVNALPGDNALYVVGGTTLTGGGIVHGTEIGALTAGGVDTVRIDVLPAGMGLNSATYIQLAAAGAGSFAAGGALSLAGGDYVEINTDDLRVINTTSGNQSTTLTVANIQMPPSVASTVPLQINNTAGGINLVGASGKGQIAGFSSIAGDNLIAGNSTITNNLFVSGYSAFGTIGWNQALGISTTIGALRVNNIQIPDNITGVTNAPNPNQSRIENFSSIQSGNLSCINLQVSTINGIDWNDISGGGGGSSTITSTFNQLFTSSLRTSTLVGYSFPGGAVPVSTIGVEGGFQFTGDYQGNAQSGRFLSSLRNINSDGEWLDIRGGGSNKEFSLFYNTSLGGNTQYVRIGGGSFFDTKIRNYLGGGGAVSTSHILTSSIIGDPIAGLDVSGNINMNATLNIPLANGGINFDDGSFVNYTRLMRRDIATNNMLSVVNTPGLSSNNMVPMGVGELWVTGGADNYSALRIYNEFPYDNFGMDIIDANGTTMFEAFACGQVPGGFLTEIAGVSSITGFTAIGGQSATGFDNLITVPKLSTLAIEVSSINGLPPGSGGGTISSFSDLYTSSFFFSTATSVGSNANYNYPILIDYDNATNISTGGVAIAVQNHNYASGFVVNRVEIGARGNGENYIMSVWPGQNLEDLAIDATEVRFNDGNFSTIVNSDPYGLITNGAISAPSLLVSSINGNDARPAYTNNLTLSTMELYNTSTTLMYWDNTTTRSNINTSGYDAVVGVDGTYKIGTSFQFISAGAPNKVEFFVLKNDVPISYGGGVCEVQNNQEIIQYCEIVEPLVNGDKIQAGCYTTGTGVFVSTINGTAIQSPAVILTMYKVD